MIKVMDTACCNWILKRNPEVIVIVVQESQDRARYLGVTSAYLRGLIEKKVRALFWPRRTDWEVTEKRTGNDPSVFLLVVFS